MGLCQNEFLEQSLFGMSEWMEYKALKLIALAIATYFIFSD